MKNQFTSVPKEDGGEELLLAPLIVQSRVNLLLLPGHPAGKEDEELPAEGPAEDEELPAEGPAEDEELPAEGPAEDEELPGVAMAGSGKPMLF